MDFTVYLTLGADVEQPHGRRQVAEDGGNRRAGVEQQLSFDPAVDRMVDVTKHHHAGARKGATGAVFEARKRCPPYQVNEFVCQIVPQTGTPWKVKRR